VFRIFAARAAAELHRIRAEERVREREKKLTRLLDSAMDAIIELDRRLAVVSMNPAAEKMFQRRSETMAGNGFAACLTDESFRMLSSLVRELVLRPKGRQQLWVPEGLQGRDGGGRTFSAEATLSRVETDREIFFTLIMRDVSHRREAEREIRSLRSEAEYLKKEFRAGNNWMNGGHNRTTIKNFYGTQQEHPHETYFELDADEPPLLLGEDKGPNPVEYLLTALAACVTTSIVYHAAAKGIALKSVESRLEGDIDLQGFLGIRDDVRRGYEEIRMFFKIDADVPEEELEKIVALGPSFSPVFDSITKGVPVKVALERGASRAAA
jgi:PAS domain S-box-containing protein